MSEAGAAEIVRVPQRQSLIAKFANRYSIEAGKLMTILKATAFAVRDGEVTDEQMAALLVVADQYGLNPFTKEIFAFPDKQGGIVPVVGVDGWSRIINDRDELDGIEFTYSEEKVEIGDARFPGLKHPAHEWIECVLSRKDRAKPIVVREYLDEVYRPPFKVRRKDGSEFVVEGPWQSHTRRMHRHKVLIQTSRVAFGFTGIYDEDEAARIIEHDVTPAAPAITDRSGPGALKAALAATSPATAESAPSSPASSEPIPATSAAEQQETEPPKRGDPGTPENKAKFIAKIKGAKDSEVLALVTDDANIFSWSPADLGEINKAYFDRQKELEG